MAIGRALRTRAFHQSGDERMETLREAVSVLGGSQSLLERARALTELGTALRHARHRAAARAPLREALDLADTCGALALVARIRGELGAAGAKPRRAALSGAASLTQREHEVTQRAAEGMSNREIAAALFVTIKTVEWHLRNVFLKLGIRSRRELAESYRSEPQSTEGGGQAPNYQT